MVGNRLKLPKKSVKIWGIVAVMYRLPPLLRKQKVYVKVKGYATEEM